MNNIIKLISVNISYQNKETKDNTGSNEPNCFWLRYYLHLSFVSVHAYNTILHDVRCICLPTPISNRLPVCDVQ